MRVGALMVQAKDAARASTGHRPRHGRFRAAKLLNVESVRMLLNGYGYTGIPIEASNTPFRR